jgi:hypothetical protein
MTLATFSTSLEAQQAAVLLKGYRFEMGQHDARQWVSLWLEFYRPIWIRDAVVEALYQGRYKSVSVRQILELWHRRGQPIRHVTHDFEAAICREFGDIKAAPMPAAAMAKPSKGIAPHRSIRRQESRGSSEEALPTPVGTHALATSTRANEIVSFNLAANLATLPLTSPGMAAFSDSLSDSRSNSRSDSRPDSRSDSLSNSRSDSQQENAGQPAAAPESTRASKSSRKAMDNKAWREFSSYTTPTYADIDSEEALNAQRQFKGVLYSSAKAIQPFKPALPFSAQTLRLAKQKAIASMADAL